MMENLRPFKVERNYDQQKSFSDCPLRLSSYCLTAQLPGPIIYMFFITIQVYS